MNANSSNQTSATAPAAKTDKATATPLLTEKINGQDFALIRYGEANTITVYPVENLPALQENWRPVGYSELNAEYAALVAVAELAAMDLAPSPAMEQALANLAAARKGQQ
ncbi:MAG: hypothetical protein KGL39_55065 [Patescibacteria group bacterium]|nr:hypothetical protein [Patescibacteria group bacterium]